MAVTDTARLSTATPYIQDLNTQVRKGEIKVPQFQRPFVWEAVQALALLDSVSNNYPIGSLLIWRTADKLATERNIGDFSLPVADDLTPTEYVLDGQQRLTVLYSVLGSESDDDGFSAVYNLKDQTFHEASSIEVAPYIFPMRWLYQTSKMLDFRTKLQEQDSAAELQVRLDSLIQVFTRYQIPVVTLRDLTIEEVCPIFERINSSGTRLSIFDLMVAATWTKTFDLNEKVEEISDSLALKNFGDIQGTTVLKCLAAVQDKSTNRERILALRRVKPTDMNKLVTKTRKAIVKAVDQLITDFKIYSLDFLPYEAHLVILTYIYSQNPRLSAQQLKRVRQWFWRTAFEERYRGAPDTFVTKDLETIQKFVLLGSQDEVAEYGGVPRDAVLRAMIFRKNNSRSRAFALVLAKQNPRNMTNGNTVDTSEALSVYNKRQFHHVFPEAFLRKLDPKIERSRTLNFVMLSAAENNFVSDADPKSYIPMLIEELGDHAGAVFASNLLPNPTTYDYATADLDSFIEARLGLVRDAIDSLCKGAA